MSFTAPRSTCHHEPGVLHCQKRSVSPVSPSLASSGLVEPGEQVTGLPVVRLLSPLVLFSSAWRSVRGWSGKGSYFFTGPPALTCSAKRRAYSVFHASRTSWKESGAAGCERSVGVRKPSGAFGASERLP